jgi:hypothetical protein
MMIERHTLALIAICRKFNQIGNDKRASSDRQSMARSRLVGPNPAQVPRTPFVETLPGPWLSGPLAPRVRSGFASYAS